MQRLYNCLIVILLLLLFPVNCSAINIILGWDAVDHPDIAGYEAYHRMEGEAYDYNKPEIQVTTNTCIVAAEQQGKHYFVIKAYDNQNRYSADSNEISITIDSATWIMNPTNLIIIKMYQGN